MFDVDAQLDAVFGKEGTPERKISPNPLPFSTTASALSNAELLGILIGSGSTDESAVDLMKRILKDCDNNLNQLGKKRFGLRTI